MLDDLFYLDIAEASELLASGDLSPVELTRAHLERIDSLNGALGAFVCVVAERALEHAKVAETELRQGRSRGPLHGIPFGLKDVYDTAGIATTGNSPAFRDRIPVTNAFVVQRLLDAGAILLGKQATHELTYGGVSAELPWPPPRNPWHRDYDTGGSSSGSGAAVAAGLSMFALGTDTGGSVRNPAAHCGVVGFKPTFGLISRTGVMKNSASFDHCGPLARTALDAALVLDGIAGFDAADLVSIRQDSAPRFAERLDGGIDGWRIGVLADLYEKDLPAADEMRGAIDVALAQFTALGARPDRAVISPLERYARCKITIQRPEIYEEYRAELSARPGDFGRKFLARIEGGKDIAAAAYLAAQRERRVLTAEMTALFEDFDILVTAGPPGPQPISDVAESWVFDRPEITVPFSLTGMPALAMCIGFAASGLPLSLQIIGPHAGDVAVLRAAHAYQSVTDWHKRHPAL